MTNNKCRICGAFLVTETMCNDCFQDAQDNVKKTKADKAVIEAAFEWRCTDNETDGMLALEKLSDVIENHPDYKGER